jgi:ectoine hydroxylase-related dioxygenase (phytanoyl-CoA dioxygenase family)
MKLVAANTGGELKEFISEHESEGPKIKFIQEHGWRIETPVFEPGDAVFFDRYTLHGTSVVGTKTRYSVKITGVAHEYAHLVDTPLSPAEFLGR